MDYSAFSAYIKAYPNKLAAWFCDRMVDDDMDSVVREYHEYATFPDQDGPAYAEGEF